jgi:hypothetical protein
MQGAQKLRSEAHFKVRRNDEVAAQRCRWTFYETIKNYRNMNDLFKSDGIFRISVFGRLFAIFLLTGIGDFDTLTSSSCL